MQVLETIFYFILTLGVLVLVHELGHFLAAKAFRMRVDRFSIGFPPRAFGKKIGETDYCISWIPIGGYVKIAGMIDESFDTDYLEKSPEPWEFRAKPIWQRMIVISAGVIMNILLAIVIFWGINYFQGTIVRETTQVGYVMEGSPAAYAGLEAGDKIVAVNGQKITNWDQILSEIYLQAMGGDHLSLTLLRNGQERNVAIPRDSIPDPGERLFGIVPENTEIVVSAVEPGKPAEKAGLQPMDVLVSMGGVPIRFDQKVTDMVKSHAGRPLQIEWKRNGQLMSSEAVPTSEGRIGIAFAAHYNGPVTHIKYSLLEALPRGLSDIGNVGGLFVRQIWQIITGKMSLSQSVGGPVKIAQMATQTAERGVATYLGFMALLSLSLAFLNILPFPALDGGHLAFLIYEGIFRREIPVKVKLGLQKAGFLLLLLFMAFVVYNDIRHF